MATPLSIDAYKRKQNVLAAKAQKRRNGGASVRTKENYTAEQRRYLDACVENHADPDTRLLAALKEERFVLKLDKFGEQELAFHTLFLQKTKKCKSISLSLGSVAVNRDLRGKFERLGLKKAYAYSSQGAASVVRAASAAASKTPDLLRFHLIGVQIPFETVSLLSKAVFQCRELEDISLNGTNLGDDGFEAVVMAVGKCPKLHLLSLAGCKLTDNSKAHIAKIISLHGVIKDESVWSSSLRGEVAPVVPELLLNLSRNNLGDDSAAEICEALYNDKWLLGINLGENEITQQGTDLLINTLAKNNRTLAILGLTNMKEPVPTNILGTLESLLRDRDRFLQQVATESREKRMALGALLLEWGVTKETVVEICYLESAGEGLAGNNNAGHTPKKAVLVSPRGQQELVHPHTVSENNLLQHSKENNNSNNSSNNNDEEEDEDDGNVASTAEGHVKTIEYLIGRLSELEADKRKMAARVNSLEAENKQLRAELQARPKPTPAPGISAIEAQIIAQLESSITSLAEQVEHIEQENLQL